MLVIARRLLDFVSYTRFEELAVGVVLVTPVDGAKSIEF